MIAKMEVFGNYAYYYNSFYKDKNYAAEADTVSALLKRYSVSEPVRVLDMGCGTGRHDLELLKHGYQIRGIDISETMIEIAKRCLNSTNVDRLSFEVGDIRAYHTENPYDSVISLFHVMSYQTDNDALLGALQTASDALNTGGILLFDSWYGPGVLSDKPSVRVKQVEDEQNVLIRYADPVLHAQENLVDVNYNVLVIDKKTGVARQIEESHVMRYLFTPEVTLLLNMAGFELLDCVDCNTLHKADYDSWTAYFIARKR